MAPNLKHAVLWTAQACCWKSACIGIMTSPARYSKWNVAPPRETPLACKISLAGLQGGWIRWAAIQTSAWPERFDGLECVLGRKETLVLHANKQQQQARRSTVHPGTRGCPPGPDCAVNPEATLNAKGQLWRRDRRK